MKKSVVSLMVVILGVSVFSGCLQDSCCLKKQCTKNAELKDTKKSKELI